MNIRTLLNYGLTSLSKSKLIHSANNSQLAFKTDLEVLLAYSLNIPVSTLRVQLISNPELETTPENKKVFLNLVEKRSQNIPVAYLTGEQDFWSLNFHVNKNVLIPRQETECLIEFVLEQFKNHKEVSGLDLGTGCGAIALTLAHENPEWKLVASDVSTRALECAKHNALRLKLQHVQFFHSNWFTDIPALTFDFIVSNPPYIEEQAAELELESIQHEPRIALTSGSDGLDAIRIICKNAARFLKPKGFLVIEHGYQQGEQVKQIFLQNDFIEVACRKDYAQLDRFTFGLKKY